MFFQVAESAPKYEHDPIMQPSNRYIIMFLDLGSPENSYCPAPLLLALPRTQQGLPGAVTSSRPASQTRQGQAQSQSQERYRWGPGRTEGAIVF
jgi:hypothetical protein